MKATVTTTPVTRTDQDSRASSWQPIRQRTEAPHTVDYNHILGGATAPPALASQYCVTIVQDVLSGVERQHESALLLQEGLSLTITEARAFVAGSASVTVALDSTGYQLLDALLQSLGLHFEATRM